MTLDALLRDVVASRRGHSAGSGLRGRQTAGDTDVGPSVRHLAAQSLGEPHQVEITKACVRGVIASVADLMIPVFIFQRDSVNLVESGRPRASAEQWERQSNPVLEPKHFRGQSYPLSVCLFDCLFVYRDAVKMTKYLTTCIRSKRRINLVM